MDGEKSGYAYDGKDLISLFCETCLHSNITATYGYMYSEIKFSNGPFTGAANI